MARSALNIAQPDTTYPVPVPTTTHQFHLLFHSIDVLEGPLLRMHPSLNGGIFSRQTKGVPSDRVQDLVALHVVVPRQDIGYSVHSQVAQMQCTGGVREHGQHIGLPFIRCAEVVPLGCQSVPVRLPFLSQLWRAVCRRPRLSRSRGAGPS